MGETYWNLEGVGSGEGVLVKADSKGKISVVGLTPKLGR